MKTKKVSNNSSEIGVLLEDMRGQISIIAEQTSEIPKMKKDVGDMKDDIEIIKIDIELIKYDLRRKVNMEDFAALEKRVSKLESRK